MKEIKFCAPVQLPLGEKKTLIYDGDFSDSLKNALCSSAITFKLLATRNWKEV